VFEVSKRQCKAVFALSFYDLEELVNIKPAPGSCYVLSSSEPFNEEMEIDFEKLTNWLTHYGLPQYHVHVSGHVMPLQLRSVLKEINAQRVFPIHTENTELFVKFMRDMPSRIVAPEKQKEYQL
jgi:ribonuclease J